MKESTKKTISYIVSILQGCILGAFTILFILDLRNNVFNIFSIITVSVMLAIAIAAPFILKAIKKAYDKKHTKIVDFPGQENQIEYNSPFPEIDKNPAQSAMIQVYLDFLASKYHVQGCMEVDEKGRIVIGYMEPQNNDEDDVVFREIDELILPSSQEEYGTYSWKAAAASLLDMFKESCKKVLGDYK